MVCWRQLGRRTLHSARSPASLPARAHHTASQSLRFSPHTPPADRRHDQRHQLQGWVVRAGCGYTCLLAVCLSRPEVYQRQLALPPLRRICAHGKTTGNPSPPSSHRHPAERELTEGRKQSLPHRHSSPPSHPTLPLPQPRSGPTRRSCGHLRTTCAASSSASSSAAPA